VGLTDKRSEQNLEELKSKSVRGGIVTIGSRFFSVVISLASTAILARILTPFDFGVVAMVLSVSAFVAVFRDFGLSSAAIQKGSTLTDKQSNALFWVNVAAGILLTVAFACSAPVVAWIYGNDDLIPVTVVVSLSFVLSSLGAQHAAALQRHMLFQRKAIADIAGTVVTFLVAVVLAFKGFAYWSLVMANIAGVLTTTLMLMLLSPFHIRRPSKDVDVKELLHFGGRVTAFEFINYFHRNLDNILIGKFWGSDALGVYSRAYQLLMFPITNLRAPITAVAFPAMSRLQDDPSSFRTYYCRVAHLLAFASMPLVAFLYVAAPEVVHVLLGSQWNAVIPVFKALAITAFIQPVASLRGLVALASGRSTDYLWLGVINAIVACAAFVAGLPWGPEGVAWAYGIAIYALLYPTLTLSYRSTAIRMIDFWQTIQQPALTSTASAIAVLSIPPLDLLAGHVVLTLLLKLLAFFACWFLANLLWPNGWQKLKDIASLLKKLKS
jgi:PST family polysaccharide transporter